MKQKKSKNDSSISSSDNASVKIKSTAGVKESLVVAEDAVESPGTPFPIVGIGASAGGLEAFTVLLEHLPCDTGMAFVLIQHLSP